MTRPSVLLAAVLFAFLPVAAEAQSMFSCGASSYSGREGAYLQVTVLRGGDTSTVEKAKLWAKDGDRDVFTPRELPFGVGQSSNTIDIWIPGDSAWRGNVVTTLRCTNVANEGGNAELTVIEDEAYPVMTIQPAMPLRVAEGTKSTLTVKILPPFAAEQELRVTISTTDLVLDASGFRSTQTYSNLQVTALADGLWEPDETFPFSIDGEGIHAEGMVVVLDADAPKPRFESAEYQFDEAVGHGVVVIERPGLTSAADFELGWTARDGNLWPATRIPVHFGDGEVRREITIPIDDELYTSTRSADLELWTQHSQCSFTRVRITDDEPMPELRLSDLAVTEGPAGQSKDVNFTISLTYALGKSLVLPMEIVSLTAVRYDDFYPPDSRVTVPAGQKSVEVWFAINGDAEPEPDETFEFRITSCCSGLATPVKTVGTCTIQNDDGAGAVVHHIIYSMPASVAESDQLVPVTIRRSGATDKASTLTVRATPGTPTVQPQIPPVKVDFLAGQTATTADLFVDDAVYSGDRTVLVDLVVSGVVEDTRSLQITENEARPAITLGNGIATEALGGTKMPFSISVVPAYAADVPVEVKTESGSARASKDFKPFTKSVKVRAGETSASFSIDVVDDAEEEGDEQFDVTAVAAAPYGGGPVPLRGKGTIRDNDGVVRTLLPDGEWVRRGDAFQLTLDVGEAASSAQTVRLESSDAAVCSVPATVTLPWNARSVVIPLTCSARGSAAITATLPSSQKLIAVVHVFEEHAAIALPYPIQTLQGASEEVWILVSPSSTDDVRVELRVLDPSLAVLPASVVVPAGGMVMAQMRTLAAGSTQIEVKLPQDHGGTTLQVPLQIDPRGHHRAVRH